MRATFGVGRPRPLRALVICVSLLAGATAASAHARLDHASPSIGSVIQAAPDEVRMWFTQALEPRFSTAELRSGAGAVVGNGVVDTADPKQLVIAVHGLAPGKYTVTWKVLSVDTHRTEGSFTFEVKP